MPLKPIKTKQRIFADGVDAKKAIKVAMKLKTRWPEMEPLILKHPETAFEYAMFVIKDRWPEAEQVILKDYSFANYYAYYILKHRWPELEQMYKERPNEVSYKNYNNLMKVIGKTSLNELT